MTEDGSPSAEEPEAGGDSDAADIVAPLAGIQRELLGAHFLLISRLLRRSARQDYAGYEPQNLVERRVVLTLFRAEEARVSELAGLLGNDVAQVSRALGSLRSSQLAWREKQRDPYVLTPAGAELGALLDNVALQREEELARGLHPQEMFELAGLLSHLLTRATALRIEESALTRDGAAKADPGTERPDLSLGSVPEIHSRLQSAILNLATIIARGATLSFKRLAGLSHYEWRLLANIASRPRIAFMEVVELIDSDKAQVSRALDGMVGSALLERSGGQGRQAVRFALTEEGHRLHAIMRADALRRNALIQEGLKPSQQRRLRVYIEHLITNAAAMAERAG